MTQIEIIKALSDNYIYVLHNPINKQTAVIDPGEAQPVIELLEKKNWNLSHIFNTHHHEDHIGGNQKLVDKYKCKLIAPKYDQNKIHNCDQYVLDGDEIDMIGKKAKVLHTPGHTIGHICYYIDSLKVLFSGDTLFRLGCGRIFEGTFEQMKDSLDKILNLPDDILVYCGHEYTMSNANFCKSIVYNNDEELDANILEIKNLRNEAKPTIPFFLGQEKKLNPFLRYNDINFKIANNVQKLNSVETFKYFRKLKDNY
ncbi:hydroxyacylglutathione hydrolase [Alphaproteobacteria bacterium]|nr:hydroxyacylglutathione hydrolase [Alphaproteobacteria bacterium]